MFSHAFDITAPADQADPSLLVLPFPVSRLAVLLFFSLSGFLVAGSLVKRGVADFAIARALRLIPGLWAMLLVTVVVLGLAFNSGTLGDLLKSTSFHRYVGFNLLLLGRAYSLDGIFAANRLPELINGSLWTIPQEVRCYFLLAAIGATGLLASRRTLTVAFVVLLVIDLIVPAEASAVVTATRPLAVAFFFGVLLYLWREHVFLSWPLAVTVVAGALLLPTGPAGEAALAMAAAYATLVIAILVPRPAKAASAALPDYSYGIYIYGFPAQQAAVALGIGVTPYANIATALLLAVPAAALSWHLVEKPALALKPRLTRTPALPVPRDAPG